MTFQIIQGDVARVCSTLEANSFDAVLCDPPYGLAFMGKRWDYEVPSAETWAEVLRVCKPGAPLLAFFGTRTYHRGVVRIEDAGWEIRDQVAWMYGQGFPKSHNISKAIDEAKGMTREVVGYSKRHVSGKPEQKTEGLVGSATFRESIGMGAFLTKAAHPFAAEWEGYGTALKPAHEPIVLARKPLEGTMVHNVERYGVGGLAIDACRVFTDWSERPDSWKRSGHSAKPEVDKIAAPPGVGINCHPEGRWPANVILDEEAGALLDEQSEGKMHSAGKACEAKFARGENANTYGKANVGAATGARFGDFGGASRFFYCAKASTKERSKGNKHPTVKPLALTTYLARLIMPPNVGRILVPFAGSGSEMMGAAAAGWKHVVGIERETEYVLTAARRLSAGQHVTFR